MRTAKPKPRVPRRLGTPPHCRRSSEAEASGGRKAIYVVLSIPFQDTSRQTDGKKDGRSSQTGGNAPTFCPDQGGISHPDSGGTLVEASSTVVSPPFDAFRRTRWECGTPQEGREEVRRSGGGHRRRRQAVHPHNHAHRAGEGREAPACCCVTRIAQLVPPATALVQL